MPVAPDRGRERCSGYIGHQGLSAIAYPALFPLSSATSISEPWSRNSSAHTRSRPWNNPWWGSMLSWSPRIPNSLAISALGRSAELTSATAFRLKSSENILRSVPCLFLCLCIGGLTRRPLDRGKSTAPPRSADALSKRTCPSPSGPTCSFVHETAWPKQEQGQGKGRGEGEQEKELIILGAETRLATR